ALVNVLPMLLSLHASPLSKWAGQSFQLPPSEVAIIRSLFIGLSLRDRCIGSKGCISPSSTGGKCLIASATVGVRLSSKYFGANSILPNFDAKRISLWRL